MYESFLSLYQEIFFFKVNNLIRWESLCEVDEGINFSYDIVELQKNVEKCHELKYFSQSGEATWQLRMFYDGAVHQK